MTVWIDSARKTVALKYNGITGDSFEVRATRAGDTHAHASGPHKNQVDADGTGSFIETFPADFTGSVLVELTGVDGSRSSGTISVA